jgi:hypothetical protein
MLSKHKATREDLFSRTPFLAEFLLGRHTTVGGSPLLGPPGCLCSSDFGHRDGQSTAAVGTTAINAVWRTSAILICY